MTTMDIDEIINDMNYMYLSDNQDIVSHITNSNIDEMIKKTIINLIENNDHASYIDIYNICIENDIELPPI